MKSYKLLKLSLMLLLVFCFFNFNFTTISANSSENLEIENYVYSEFTDEEWNEIIEIEVVNLTVPVEEDEFLKEAKRRNIPIKYQFTSIALRSTSSSYFNSITWITRSDGRSLSVTPKNALLIAKEASWSELVRYFQYHPFYTSEPNPTKLTSLYNQYVCHVDYAKFKTPWNIEPYKPDKGYWQFVNSLCN